MFKTHSVPDPLCITKNFKDYRERIYPTFCNQSKSFEGKGHGCFKSFPIINHWAGIMNVYLGWHKSSLTVNLELPRPQTRPERCHRQMSFLSTSRQSAFTVVICPPDRWAPTLPRESACPSFISFQLPADYRRLSKCLPWPLGLYFSMTEQHLGTLRSDMSRPRVLPYLEWVNLMGVESAISFSHTPYPGAHESLALRQSLSSSRQDAPQVHLG